VITSIGRFLILIDPTLKAPKISENLHQPLSKPQTSRLEASADELESPSADSLPTERNER
jgi:hypothetical protein